MKKKILLTALLAASFVIPQTASAQMRYRERKYFGPISPNAFTFSVGFLDGPNADYLTKHLDEWATLRGGSDDFNAIGTSPYIQAGYERMISPVHFVSFNLNFTYLKTESVGSYGAELPDTIIALNMQRQFKTYYLSMDAGMGYYFVEPTIRTLCPYVSGGFSAAFPLNRLDTDLQTQSDGQPFPNPDENVSDNNAQWGIHAEFGMKYYITNVWAAGLEGRYQLSSSKFEIHGYNFDIDYGGLSLALKLYYNF